MASVCEYRKKPDGGGQEPGGRPQEGLVMTSPYRCLLVVILMVFGWFNLITVHPGHNWSGDFAQYIIHTENLLAGRAYDAGVYYSPPGHPELNFRAAGFSPDKYPPALPLMLTPLVALWGRDLVAVKSLNVLFWALWAVAMFGLVRRRAGEATAFWVTVMLLTSPWFFMAKQSIYSDLPFLFFATAALWVYEIRLSRGRGESPPGWGWLGLFILLAGWAVWLRSVGLALFLAGAIHLALVSRRWLAATAVLAGGGLFFFGQTLITGPAVGYGDQIAQAGSAGLIVNSFHTALMGVYSLLLYFGPDYDLARPLVVRLVFGLLLVGVIVLIVRKRWQERRLEMIDLFGLIYTGVILLWPWSTVTRFYLPSLAVWLLWLVEVIRPTARTGRRVWLTALAVMVAFNLGLTWAHRHFDDNDLTSPQATELFHWVADNLGPDDHYIFFKPRILAFYTGRTGSVFNRHAPVGPQLNLFRQAGINWYILRAGEAGQPGVADRPDLERKWSNGRFTVFRARETEADRRSKG